MSLHIETFSNADTSSGWRPGNNFGGSSLFKALGHPRVQAAARDLVARLNGFRRVAVYDPEPSPVAEPFDAFFGLGGCPLAGVFVQRLEDVGQTRLGQVTRPVTELAEAAPDALLITAFDAGLHRQQTARLVPPGCTVLTLDEMRLPDDWLGNPRNYLDPVNFATNFALLRDTAAADGRDAQHTRVCSANYWSGYGAADPALWLCLFDAEGAVLAEWVEPLPGAFATFAIDSRAVRERFGLGDFAGSLFIHALRAKGHDVVKYALDCYGDDARTLSCTHDANAWPADFYAGLPAPEADERLILWVQNSHPLTIPPGAIGFNAMGSQDVAWLPEAVPPFGTRAVDVGALLPDLAWPTQIEVQAGRYFVRPRYEVTRTLPGGEKRTRIAHANVERTDLTPDPRIPGLDRTMGKGYVMPLPVLPVDDFHTVTLPTPMATGQDDLPVKAVLYDADGSQVAERFLGRVERRESIAVDIDAWLAEAGKALPSGYGHVEYLYDFRAGGGADGWLHALARVEQRASGHRAETIFGAHIYNTPIVFRDEPQSYTRRPPGLTTRLFLRLGEGGVDTLCHLVYPASLPAGPGGPETSSTQLTLFDGEAKEVAAREVAIAHGGSHFFRVDGTFSQAERERAGPGAWVQIRDTTCRLFGFHGLIAGATSFCLDHMFGF